ncbi:glycosyl hydrolase [Prosthecochloris sp. GSB1]|uniref:glycosyltransferase family 2 protein n=1 Tax=Prosthecochloris sp. GSB1 TaxID=281093 RepID=UPI000B8CF923|nr:glycosyltransferase family 2 protein [Prosthecochloris sp. GSB1]ASQ90034.1 glycosyl hydrolase [Prosthecochloris sp. GSB1]
MAENAQTSTVSPPEARLAAVEVVIPHYRGFSMLERCLRSLSATRYPSMRICVVDNASGEEEIGSLAARFDGLRVIAHTENKGFAGGCNSGLFSSTAKYLVFMNDDVTVEPSWLRKLVDAAEEDPSIAALQPKVLSAPARRNGESRFDYAGAAGGRIDRLGYPFCYGRTFRETERDEGQYDRPRDIFWASGAAMFVRRDAAVASGGFDEEFFMHMEEIDLCWRLLLRGLRVVSAPGSVVYHEGGASLAAGSPEKRYLNHRNNIAMLLRNMSLSHLFWAFPLRLMLELTAAAGYFFRGDDGLRAAGAVLRALRDNAAQVSAIGAKRREVQLSRRVRERTLFRGAPFSVFFVRRRSG